MITKTLACPEPPGAEAGVQVYRDGGNAIDAAVAASFAQAVTNPLGTGIGGMAHILLMRPGWTSPVVQRVSRDWLAGVHRRLRTRLYWTQRARGTKPHQG